MARMEENTGITEYIGDANMPAEILHEHSADNEAVWLNLF